MDPARARELLGVAPTATGEELRTAYRRHAARHHPDRGGDPERFTLGVQAFEALRAHRPQREVVFARHDGWTRRARRGTRDARSRASVFVGAVARGFGRRRDESAPRRVS